MCIKGYSQESEKTTQRQPNPKKISANHISDKSLVSRTCKELAAQQQQKDQILKCTNLKMTWIDISPKTIYKCPTQTQKEVPYH